MLMWRRGPHTRRYSLYALWVADSLSSSVPRMPIHIYIKNITEKQIYIYKKIIKGLDKKCDVPNANTSLYSTKKIDRYTLSQVTPLKIIILIDHC